MIKHLIKIYIKFAKNWISKLSPHIPMKSLIVRIENKAKLVRWDPKKTSRWQSMFINRGLNPSFHHPVLLLILNCHNKASNCAQPKKTEVPHQSYFFYLGSFSSRKKGLFKTDGVKPIKLNGMAIQVPIDSPLLNDVTGLPPDFTPTQS